MNTKILFLGILCLGIFSCEKANLKPQKEPQPATQSSNSADLLKFKKDIQIMAGENCEGYVILTVKSNDQSYLESYCKEFEKSKINLIPKSSLQNPNQAIDNSEESGSGNGVSIHMNIDNLVYKTDTKDQYAFGFSSASGNEKTYSASFYNIFKITFSQPVLAVSIYNQYLLPNWVTPRDKATAQWTVNFKGSPTEYPFTSNHFDYNSNLDVQTFWGYFASTTFPLASNATLSNSPFQDLRLLYRARYNYSGPILPSGSIETNGIMKAEGRNPYFGESAPATVTVYAL